MAVSEGKVNGYIDKAKNGNPRAQYNLAIAFMNGEHVPQDYDKAEVLLRQASDMGHAGAADALVQLDYVRSNSFSARDAGLDYEKKNWAPIIVPVVISLLVGGIGAAVYLYLADPTNVIADKLVVLDSENAYPPRTGKKLLVVDGFEGYYQGLFMDIRCKEGLAIDPQTEATIYERMNQISRLMEVTSAEVERMQISANDLLKDLDKKCENPEVMEIIAKAKNLLMDETLEVLVSLQAGDAARRLVGTENVRPATPQPRTQPQQQAPTGYQPLKPPAGNTPSATAQPQQARPPARAAAGGVDPGQMPVFTEEQMEFYRVNYPDYHRKLTEYYKQVEEYQRALEEYRRNNPGQ